MTYRTTISLNNSGGSWWLSTQDLSNLENAGWHLGRPGYQGHPHDISRDLPESEAMYEFESITGYTGNEEGCNCCGSPFWYREEQILPCEAREAKPDALTLEAEAWLHLLGEPV